MPLRDLFYVADQYQELVKDMNLYKSALVKIPTPRFVVFYNGTSKRPDKEVFKLSDSYDVATDDPQLELKVISLNINRGCNEKLMSKCSSLREYALFVEKVREYTEIMDRDLAVEKAVDECIKEGILAEFLRKQKSEVMDENIFSSCEIVATHNLIPLAASYSRSMR